MLANAAMWFVKDPTEDVKMEGTYGPNSAVAAPAPSDPVLSSPVVRLFESRRPSYRVRAMTRFQFIFTEHKRKSNLTGLIEQNFNMAVCNIFLRLPTKVTSEIAPPAEFALLYRAEDFSLRFITTVAENAVRSLLAPLLQESPPVLSMVESVCVSGSAIMRCMWC